MRPLTPRRLRSRPAPLRRPGLGSVGGRGTAPGQPEDATVTEFTTDQLATILSALAGKQRKPTTRAAAMRAIHHQAAAIGHTREAVLAFAPGLLEGWLEPAAWREQLLSGTGPESLDPTPPDGSRRPVVAVSSVSLRPGTKQALIAGLMAREHGATLEELIAATGWLPHTTRAALTGLRRKGCTLDKNSREDGTTAYRIVLPDKVAAGDAVPSGAA